MGIGEAAKVVGLSEATLRLWERQSLVHPTRTPGGSRRYRASDVARLRRVRYLRRVEHLNPPAIARILRDGSSHAYSLARAREAPARELGRLLRERRLRAGLTLKETAHRSALSISFLSAVERGVNGASIASLQRLTKLYGMTVLDLVQAPARTGRVVRAHERPGVPSPDKKVVIEQLALGQIQMEPQIFTIQPGAGSEGSYDHVGEEFVYVLDGTLEVLLETGERYELSRGDCLYFPSTIPHSWRNPGRKEAKLLWVNTPPTF